MSDFINSLSVVLVLICWLLIIKKLILSKYGPVKTVKAEVADKYKTGNAYKYSGTFKREGYVVVFNASGKKLSFAVSEFSYNNYKIGEKGTLRYKGSRIISFK